MKKEYPYIDVKLSNMAIISWGKTKHATLTGKTKDPDVHRVFLTPGQFNKLVKRLQ